MTDFYIKVLTLNVKSYDVEIYVVLIIYVTVTGKQYYHKQLDQVHTAAIVHTTFHNNKYEQP